MSRSLLAVQIAVASMVTILVGVAATNSNAYPSMLLWVPQIVGMVLAFFLSGSQCEFEAAVRFWERIQSKCCHRRARGLALLEESRAHAERVMLQRLEADAAGRQALELEVSSLSGQTWRVWVCARTTGADIRARIADLAGVRLSEVMLVCGAAPVADRELLLSAWCGLIHAPPPQLQMLRIRRECAISGSSDGTLKLWDLNGSACLATLTGHKECVTSVEVDWGSMRALSASTDGNLKLWDLSVITGSTNGTSANDSCTVACVETLGSRRNAIRCLSVDWNLRRALAATAEVLTLWDLDEATCLSTLRGHEGVVSCMAVDWCARCVLSGASDGALLLWDLDREECCAELQDYPIPVSCVALDGASKRAVSGTIDGKLKLWDTRSASCMQTMYGCWEDARCINVDWSSMCAVTGAAHGALKIWDVANGACLKALQINCERRFGDHVNSIAVDWRSGRAFGGSTYGEVRCWDLHRLVCNQMKQGHRGDVQCSSLDPIEPPAEANEVLAEDIGELRWPWWLRRAVHRPMEVAADEPDLEEREASAEEAEPSSTTAGQEGEVELEADTAGNVSLVGTEEASSIDPGEAIPCAESPKFTPPLAECSRPRPACACFAGVCQLLLGRITCGFFSGCLPYVAKDMSRK